MKSYPKIVVIPGAEKETEDTFTVVEDKLVPYKEYKKQIEERVCGELTALGLYLPDKYDWRVVRDSDQQLVLIATRKYSEIMEPVIACFPTEEENAF